MGMDNRVDAAGRALFPWEVHGRVSSQETPVVEATAPLSKPKKKSLPKKTLVEVLTEPVLRGEGGEETPLEAAGAGAAWKTAESDRDFGDFDS